MVDDVQQINEAMIAIRNLSHSISLAISCSRVSQALWSLEKCIVWNVQDNTMSRMWESCGSASEIHGGEVRQWGAPQI